MPRREVGECLEAPGILSRSVRVGTRFDEQAALPRIADNPIRKRGYGGVEELRRKGLAEGRAEGQAEGLANRLAGGSAAGQLKGAPPCCGSPGAAGWRSTRRGPLPAPTRRS